MKFLNFRKKLASVCLNVNDFKEHVDQQSAKVLAGKLFLTVLAKRKEAFVYLAVISNQIITKCQVNFGNFEIQPSQSII